MEQVAEQRVLSIWRRLLWPDWQRRKRMMRREAWVAIGGAYLLLLFAYLCPQDYRNTSPAYVLIAWAAFLVRVLQYHLGLLLLAIALVACIIRKWRMALACVPLMAFALVPAWWHWGPSSSAGTQSPSLRLMSANLLMINRDTQGIIDEVRAARPDVLLLQEYTDHWHEAIGAALAEEYPHCIFERQEDSFGMAIYSRRPFVGRPVRDVPLGSGEVAQMRAVVEAGGREVALCNIHLLPPRMLSYTIEHRRQFADLLEILSSNQKLPTIVAGDFNFTETTPQAWDLYRIGYRDAHDLAGRGRGATWPVNSFMRYLPGIWLDHVYLSPGLQCTASKTGEGRGSDHRPLVVDVSP